MCEDKSKTDVLVIGSGIAGLNFANKTSKFGQVTVITKKEIMESNTNYAQAGIAAVADGVQESIISHVQDTLRAGRGLCDRKAVEILVRNSRKVIDDLKDLGVPFDRTGSEYDLGLEGGHSRKRVFHVGDKTGSEIETVLVSNVRKNKNIEVMENCFAIDLISKNGECYGARILDVKTGKIIDVYSKVTAVATGGIGHMYKITSNPDIATGDGIAMAYDAGARIEDMEFVQFHPTTLNMANAPHFLVTEALRGAGGILVNEDGKRFVDELKPRDEVSRAIFNELKKGKVYLDVKPVDDVKDRFPMIYDRLKNDYKIDVTKDLIPVSPAAHYICGGIKTNEYGETKIKGLLAYGECACTGAHGANRLASNSLLESAVFSFLGATKIGKCLKRDIKETLKNHKLKFYDGEMKDLNRLETDLRQSMWDNVGIIRNETNLSYELNFLEKLGKRVDDLYKHGMNDRLLELRNMIAVSQLITRAALTREESRGTHYREDYPVEDKNWLKHIGFDIGLEGELYTTPIS